MTKTYHNILLHHVHCHKKKLVSWVSFYCWDQMDQLGMWLSGRAFALHVKGPGFDPRHLHLFLLKFLFRKYVSVEKNRLDQNNFYNCQRNNYYSENTSCIYWFIFIIICHPQLFQSKIFLWRCRGSNPGPLTCEASALPLSHIP